MEYNGLYILTCFFARLDPCINSYIAQATQLLIQGRRRTKRQGLVRRLLNYRSLVDTLLILF